MTVYKGTNLTALDDGKVESYKLSGKLRVLSEEFELSAALAEDDEILGPSLPRGAHVIDAKVQSTTLGATGQVSLGYKASDSGDIAEDEDAFVALADAGGAATMDRMTTEAGYLKYFDEEVQTFLKCQELSANDTGTIKYDIIYVVE